MTNLAHLLSTASASKYIKNIYGNVEKMTLYSIARTIKNLVKIIECH